MGEDGKRCPACHGAGQNSFFRGESRFLLSCEECPVCSGLGLVFDDPEENDDTGDTGESGNQSGRQ